MQISSRLTQFYSKLADHPATGKVIFHYPGKSPETYHYSTLSERSRYIKNNEQASYYTIIPVCN